MKLNRFLKLSFFLSLLFLFSACTKAGDEAIATPPEGPAFIMFFTDN